MNRALYICGIVLSMVFLGTCGYYASEISNARFSAVMAAFSSDSLMSFNGDYSALTEEAALVSLFFLIAFLVIDLMGLLKVKTTTVKVISIIGISLTAIMLVWDLMVLSSPDAISFDEVAVGFCLYAFVVLAFSIVGLVQSVRFLKRRSNAGLSSRGDLLDS